MYARQPHPRQQYLCYGKVVKRNQTLTSFSGMLIYFGKLITFVSVGKDNLNYSFY